MWKYAVLAIIALTVTLVVPTSNLVYAKFKFPSDDFANAETKDRIYSFDLDFSLVYGEDHDNTGEKQRCNPGHHICKNRMANQWRF